ncbi:glycosyltransferase, partial [Anaerolineae bacterium CFX7]|nr:glycosyltransferase [Anaerolineae bacterium CFX7]
MINLPRVSIVTPSFNQAAFLEETIRSVLTQNYPHIEYIVIDGGSTDGSVDIIRKYENRLAYWVSEQDAGQADAINKGWRRATGEIIAYLNSDDTYEPGAVRAAVEYLAQHPETAMVYGHCYQVNEHGERVGTLRAIPVNIHTLLLHNAIMQPTAFIRRRVLDHTGMLDVELGHAMDYDLWLRIA